MNLEAGPDASEEIRDRQLRPVDGFSVHLLPLPEDVIADNSDAVDRCARAPGNRRLIIAGLDGNVRRRIGCRRRRGAVSGDLQAKPVAIEIRNVRVGNGPIPDGDLVDHPVGEKTTTVGDVSHTNDERAVRIVHRGNAKRLRHK